MSKFMTDFIKHDFPLLEPTDNSVFHCPILDRDVHFEAQNVYNPAAAVLDGKVYLVYRADDLKQPELPEITCRHGIAVSEDGVHFERFADPKPVLYPDRDAFFAHEWSGGAEDLHIITGEDGLFYMNYTAWSAWYGEPELKEQGVYPCFMHTAVSKDLINWKKHGPAFDAGLAGFSRSGVVVSQPDENGNMRAVKINGKYIMFYATTCKIAYSDNLLDWTPFTYTDENGETLVCELFPEKGREAGRFDFRLREAGAAAILMGDEILLFYNANDTVENTIGQAVVSIKDLTRAIEMMDRPFLRADRQWEKEKRWWRWCNIPTIVCNTLVRFKGAWRLYYGIGDNVIGGAYMPLK